MSVLVARIPFLLLRLTEAAPSVDVAGCDKASDLISAMSDLHNSAQRVSAVDSLVFSSSHLVQAKSVRDFGDVTCLKRVEDGCNTLKAPIASFPFASL